MTIVYAAQKLLNVHCLKICLTTPIYLLLSAVLEELCFVFFQLPVLFGIEKLAVLRWELFSNVLVINRLVNQP